MSSRSMPSGGQPVGVRAGTRPPRVSIGLPVYNGADYLADALDSLLAQTFRDFELIVSDNASTDATESICRERAGRDPRIRYYRNGENVGGRRNFNRVFELATGEYFKWAAHDDVHEPSYLERCVEALDSDSTVVLVYTRARDIDEKGNTLKVVSFGIAADSAHVATRFRGLADRRHSCAPIFGVVRADVLRGTRLLADYADCDRVLLAEIGMAGRLVELPEALFLHRQHGKRSVRQFRSRQTRNAWFDSSRAGRPAFPYTKQFFGHLGAVRRARVASAEKLECVAHMPRWLFDNADGIWEDVTYAVRFTLRPIKRLLIPASRRASPGVRGEK